MIDTDKAYLLGLIIGGGVIKNGTLQIILPYKKWGNIALNPERGGKISTDILNKSAPIWKQAYGIDISYKVEHNRWKIISKEISESLIKDLSSLELPLEGEMRSIAKITTLLNHLKTDIHKQQFITGLVDTVGSLEGSHRRFSEDYQIISFEFKQDNFSLVRDISFLLTLLDCKPDQILWNHPNQHSGSDRYYKGWKKGFKIRVIINDYILKSGFVFEAKKNAADKNLKKQKHTNASSKNKLNRVSGRVCIHIDEYSDWLPEEIRGGHYIHYQHLSAHLGIEGADESINLKSIIDNFEKYISPFTILTKGTNQDIEKIIQSESYLNKTDFKVVKPDIPELIELYKEDSTQLVFSGTSEIGFPISPLLEGLSYSLFANDSSKMFGKRVRNGFFETLESKVQNDKIDDIELLVPNVGTCLRVKSKTHSSLVGFISDDFNKKMIDSIEGFKVVLKNPDYSECVKLA